MPGGYVVRDANGQALAYLYSRDNEDAVELSQTERRELMGLLSGGKHSVRKLKRAQILLAADAGASDEEIARNVGVGGSTVYRTKRRFVLGNLEAALSEEPRPGADRKLSGKEEALLVATACSDPPKGRARWTLELLAGELVRHTEHDEISRETVRRRLAENELKPWRKDMWCIPQVDGEFVARMEDARRLCRSARSETPGGLFRREPDPAGIRDDNNGSRGWGAGEHARRANDLYHSLGWR